MVDVLYSRRYQPQQDSSYWPKFLAGLRDFGKLSPQKMAAQIGIKSAPRAKESSLPTVCARWT